MSNESKLSAEQLFIYNMMKSRSGRDFIWRQLNQSYVFDSVYDSDSRKHAFNSGIQKRGLDLQREVKAASIDGYLTMVKENEDG